MQQLALVHCYSWASIDQACQMVSISFILKIWEQTTCSKPEECHAQIGITAYIPVSRLIPVDYTPMDTT